jgi:hypothetical protein
VTNRDHSLADPAFAEAALKALDAELDQGVYATTLYSGQTPCLHVANRHAQLAEDVYAGAESYFWSWGQPIAAVGNPAAAAEKVRYVLAAGNSHG